MYENNKNYPKDIAINYMGRKITYGELFENIDKTAAAFLKAGVKEKEIVTVALPSIPEALYCVYALNKIGAVANMIHPLAGTEETLYYFNEVNGRIAVIFDGAFDAISSDIAKSTVEKVIVVSPGDSLPLHLKAAYNLKVKKPKLDGKVFQSWKNFIKEGIGTEVREVKKDCHEMAIISHTGGTTGTPKGVMLSDYNTNALCYQLVCAFEYERQGRCLSVLPPFVNYSLVDSMLAMLDIGYTVIMLPKYEQNKLLKYIKDYKPNIILSIPAYWEVLVNGTDNIHVDMSCLEQIYYGGEGMSEEAEQKIGDILRQNNSKTVLCKGFGSTELTAAATQSYPSCNPIGSVGLPLVKTNCKIVNPDSYEELSYFERGEICFNGPTLMEGYYNNQSATDDVIKIHKDGERWLHTGDIGYINEDGVVFVTGRIKRIIMTKGEDGQVTKMFPDRIEKAIDTDPNVELSCVIGVPHKIRINYPKAFVVLKDGIPQSEETKQSILNSCKSALPEYMVPDEIVFRTDLPRTSRGKVDYRALETEYSK
jgi:long-chain acyl-CoA synthetase